MKWINQAKYFSIDVMGRHAICSCFMHCKDEYNEETDIPYIKLPVELCQQWHQELLLD